MAKIDPAALYERMYGASPEKMAELLAGGGDHTGVPLLSLPGEEIFILRSKEDDKIVWQERLENQAATMGPEPHRTVGSPLKTGFITPKFMAAKEICENALLLHSGNEISLVYRTRDEALHARDALVRGDLFENLSISKEYFPPVEEYKSFTGKPLAYKLSLSVHWPKLALPDETGDMQEHTINHPQNRSLAIGIERLAQETGAAGFHHLRVYGGETADDAVRAFVKGELSQEPVREF